MFLLWCFFLLVVQSFNFVISVCQIHCFWTLGHILFTCIIHLAVAAAIGFSEFNIVKGARSRYFRQFQL